MGFRLFSLAVNKQGLFRFFEGKQSYVRKIKVIFEQYSVSDQVL